MEEAILNKYVNSGGIIDQTDLLTQAEKNKMYTSVLNQGKGDDGKIYGYAYQISPGAFYYRTDIAQAVWPSYTLEEIDEMIGESWDSLLDMAAQLKAASNKTIPLYPGTAASGVNSKVTPQSGITLVPGYDSMSRIFFSQIQSPWVVNNKLVINDNIAGGPDRTVTPNLFETAKYLVDNGYCNNNISTAENYLYDTPGFANSVSVNNNFGFFLPSWGIMTTIQPQVVINNKGNTQVPNTVGVWRCARSPIDFAYGGTWLGIPKKAKNIELAKKFAYYVATNDAFKRDYALNTMNFVNSPSIMQELANELPLYYADGVTPNPYVQKNEDNSTGFVLLGGQNHYKVLLDVAQTFQGNKLSRFDAVCNNEAIVWSGKYAFGADGTSGTNGLNVAIANMKAKILSQSPGLQS